MRNVIRPRTRRTWVAALAVMVATPLMAGCDSVLATVAPLWGVAYAYELFLIPSRSLLGTGVLNIINSF